MKLGAVARSDGRLQLLTKDAYALTKAVDEFWKHPQRTATSNRFHWGRIRTLAVKANAGLDRFLADTVVLTPEKLLIRLADTDVAGTAVVEIQPWFAGAPENWLSSFDQANRVKDLYHIVTDQGLVEVVITPPVKSVLSAIKAMPGRRVSRCVCRALPA